jgi:hypothetical protein
MYARPYRRGRCRAHALGAHAVAHGANASRLRGGVSLAKQPATTAAAAVSAATDVIGPIDLTNLAADSCRGTLGGPQREAYTRQLYSSALPFSLRYLWWFQ